jgi:phenylglyoxylate dehydrogenase alpha subunit
MAVDPLTHGHLLMEYREKHMAAQQNALEVIDKIDKEFKEIFGRSYGGVVEKYRLEDADAVLVTMGSMTGAARDAVDDVRESMVEKLAY